MPKDFGFPDHPDVVPVEDPPSQAGEGIVSRRQLAFESLLADLTAKFVNPADHPVDEEINRGLRETAEFMGVERATLIEFSPDGTQLRQVHGHPCAAINPAPEILASEQFPWYAQQLRQGVTLVLRRLPDDLPADAGAARRYCVEQGLKSLLGIPLQEGDTIVAAISYGALSQFRDWSDEWISRLRLLGKVFVDAMTHQRADAALRDSEQRFRIISDFCYDWEYWLAPDGRLLYVSPSCERITGYRPEEFLADAGLLERIVHADDRPAFAEHLRSNLASEPRGIDDVTERKRSLLALEQAYREIQQLKERLERDNIYLREQTQPAALPSGIVGRSPRLFRVLEQARQVAKTNSTVLITGETGTGKELVAAAIHELSPRVQRVMVRVNCAALPAALIESELFGREEGADTGALTKQMGRFELANGSSIFLDEVGELPLELQAKLLRVLQEGRFERLGNPRTIQVDVRVVAASNRDLAVAVREGKFREDLFYRLNVFPIHLPPLRERPEDIPALTWSFVAEFGKSLGKTIEAIPRSTMDALQRYHWPGNVRELRNVVERAVILSEDPTLQIEVPAAFSLGRPRACRLEDVEREHILEVLEQTHWRVRDPGGAAELLDIKPTTLESRMAKLGIQRGHRTSEMS